MACDSIGITIVAGSDDAIDDGSISIVPVTGATVEGPGTRSCSGVGCPVNSLKVAPRLLKTRVSVTSNEELCAGVKPVCRGVKERPWAGTSEANHWNTYSVGEANMVAGCP